MKHGECLHGHGEFVCSLDEYCLPGYPIFNGRGCLSENLN